jgi:ketosteroid isomerase-like protein
MAKGEARKVVDQFFHDLDHMYDDPPTNPLRTFHEDVVFTVTGQTPMSKTNYGLKSIIEGHAAREARLFVKPKTYRMYPIEWFEEGDKVAMIGRVRLETPYGIPYNNTYFFYFRVENGKLVRVIENIDESLGYVSPFDTHLEPT